MIVRALQMRKKLHHPKCTGDGVYECEGLPSPFVFGILPPIVYLPTGLERETKDYLLSHESIILREKMIRDAKQDGYEECYNMRKSINNPLNILPV